MRIVGIRCVSTIESGSVTAMSDETVANAYAANVGITVDDSYEISWEELAWLVGHTNSMAETRLALLKSLQTALPSQESGGIANLKELLSNLIIMQTRLAGRENELDESLSAMSENPPVSHVASNQDTITSAATNILNAALRLRSKG
jgi:hypothetical protein